MTNYPICNTEYVNKNNLIYTDKFPKWKFCEIFLIFYEIFLIFTFVMLQVAVKIIDKKKSREDSYVRKNLRREGKILQMIRHSNIVQLLEIMETQNSYYLVTELCRGGDLMDYISQRRRLPEQEVKRYIRQIVSAVDYLHRLGILHRYS